MDLNSIIESDTNKWFVHFDLNTKKILKITKRELRQKPGQEVFETSNEMCREIATGTKTKNDFAVYQDMDDDGTWYLDLKGDVLVLSGSNNWVPIKLGDPGASELHCNIFTNSNTLEVSVNINRIKDIFRLKKVNEIARSDTELLNLYITKKNDPDMLITTVKVDPYRLFVKGSQTYKLNINKYVNIADISIYTREVFQNYSLSVKEAKFVTDFNSNKTRSMQTSTYGIDGQITLHPRKNEVKITSSLDKFDQSMTNHKKSLQFLVSNSNIDNIVGGFEVDYDSIIDKKNPTHVTINFDWPINPIVVYRNKFISVGLMDKE